MLLLEQLECTKHPLRVAAEQLFEELLDRLLLLFGQLALAGRDPDARRGVARGQPDPREPHRTVDVRPPEPAMLCAPEVRVGKGPRPGRVLVESADDELG